MKRTLVAALVYAVGIAGPALAAPSQEGLATFTTCMKLEGMNAANSVPGAGDRQTEFSVQIPADDMELANTLWYLRLLLLTSPEAIAAIRTAVQ